MLYNGAGVGIDLPITGTRFAGVQLSPQDHALLRVGIASKKTLILYAEAIHLTSVTAKSIVQLQQQVCVDRLQMADRFIRAAEKLVRCRPPEYRSAVSRYYYAMYHSVRAVVYFAHGGDDHQEHSTLPTKLPVDFPGHNVWLNDLKDARSRRNDADYDPYPFSDAAWKSVASNLASQAPRLAQEARTYLQRKGCAGL